MYENLTRYISMLEKKLYSGKSAGLSGYDYNNFLKHMIDDVYDFANPEKNYYEVLEKAGINEKNYMQISVSMLDGDTIFALIFTAILREKYDAGLILKLCENGCFLKWFKRLKEIDWREVE